MSLCSKSGKEWKETLALLSYIPSRRYLRQQDKMAVHLCFDLQLDDPFCVLLQLRSIPIGQNVTCVSTSSDVCPLVKWKIEKKSGSTRGWHKTWKRSFSQFPRHFDSWRYHKEWRFDRRRAYEKGTKSSIFLQQQNIRFLVCSSEKLNFLKEMTKILGIYQFLELSDFVF